jgi:hypothetical protein
MIVGPFKQAGVGVGDQGLVLQNFKLEFLLLASLSSLDRCLCARPRAYPRVEHQKCASLR